MKNNVETIMKETEETIKNLKRWSRVLRYDIVRMIENVHSGHPGGALSAADIVACLYFEVMRIRPEEPDWPDRDRFILSKGHAAPVLYSALARRGYFDVNQLKNLRQTGSFLHGHPDISTPGVDMTSGSLGQGLSVGIGMALGARLYGKDYRTYVMMGCGEMNEGQTWEAVMCAFHYRLSNITVLLDYNRLQFDGPVENVLNPGSMVKRWQGFNWNVIEIDGHDHIQILEAIKNAQEEKDVPTVIIANTVKGRGVSYMENDYLWHSFIDVNKMRQTVKEIQEEFKKDENCFYADCLW